MIIGRDGYESGPPRRVNRGIQTAQGLSLIPELDQRQVNAQFHSLDAPTRSGFAADAG